MAKDQYQLHRAALAPLIPLGQKELPSTTLAVLNAGHEDALIQFILNQSLGPLWDNLIRQLPTNPLNQQNSQLLRTSRLASAVQYLAQKQALTTLRTALDDAHIPHAVFKGCHIREKVYPDPSLRTAGDIDVLVSPNDKFKATKALCALGYKPIINPENISHELSLRKGGIEIDLHWDVMRPGRTRHNLANDFLAAREDAGSHWSLSPTATLFLMLTHPVITKYCTAPQSTIIRLLDIALWIERVPPDWPALTRQLDEAGLKAAAWVMQEWLNMITLQTLENEFSKAIQPKAWRTTYLALWLKHNLPTTLMAVPSMIQLGFTLPIHDTPTDLIRATFAAIKARNKGKKLKEKFNRLS